MGQIDQGERIFEQKDFSKILPKILLTLTLDLETWIKVTANPLS